MSWITRLRNLFESARHGREIDRELDFHLMEKADELVAHGMERPEAERQARIRFGHRQGLKEDTRAIGIIAWLDTVWNDLRYSVRGLRANPAFTLTVILSLALGIGANTAIFSFLNAVMLKSLPVQHPEELVQIGRGPEGGDVFTNPIWEAIRKRPELFSGLLAFGDDNFNLSTGGEARMVNANYVGGDFFQTLGVAPAAGRLLSGADDFRGCPAQVVLSHDFWLSEFAGERDAIGKTLSLNGHPFQIVGVAPSGFFGVEVGRTNQLYAPICSIAIAQGTNNPLDERSNWWLQLLARPKPGIELAQINAGLQAMSAAVMNETVPQWDGKNRDRYLNTRLDARPATTGLSDLRSRYRPALFMLMAVVGLVLLIACGNVANLMLARGTVRQREIAMRMALGAGRGRLVRQMLTESLLLSLVGALGGFLFARWGSVLLVQLLSTRRDIVWLDLSVDYHLLAFTIGIAVITALLFGLVPAWRSTRVDPQVAMRANGRGVLEGGTKFTLGKALVLGQVALSLVLVLGAALMLRTFHTLTTIDPGFRRDGVLVVQMDLTSGGYTDPQVLDIQHRTLERLRTVPGVVSAGSASVLQVSGMGWNGGIKVPGQPVSDNIDDRISWFNRVSDGYFGTMGTTLKRGRDFGPTDIKGSVPVAIVNEAMANQFFPGKDPVGQQFEAESGRGDEQLQVIGVVQDSRYQSLRDKPQPIVYLAEHQVTDVFRSINYMLRVDGPPSALTASIRNAVAEVEPLASFSTVTVSENLDRSVMRERLLATVSGVFGVLALVLALIGLYGLMSYSVARRRNEIGIRLALGAERIGVLQLIMAEVGRLVTMGVVGGVVIALAAGRLVATFLFGVKPNDPATIAATVGVMILVGLMAGAIPAWRAARLDPVSALRED
jgi:predicted permease